MASAMRTQFPSTVMPGRQHLLTLAIPIGEAASDAAGAMFEAFVED